MKHTVLKCVSALAFALAATAAQASPVSYNWSANSPYAIAQYGVNVGDAISGVITLDTALASPTNGNSSQSNVGYQYYASPVLQTTIQAGSYAGQFDLIAMVTNNYWAGDQIIFRAYGTPLGYFELDLVDSTNALYNSLALPNDIKLSQFNAAYFALNNGYGGQVTSFGTAAPSSAVPEPTILALFGLGLFGIAAARRKRP